MLHLKLIIVLIYIMLNGYIFTLIEFDNKVPETVSSVLGIALGLAILTKINPNRTG